MAVAIAALSVGCAEIVWHYVRHAERDGAAPIAAGDRPVSAGARRRQHRDGGVAALESGARRAAAGLWALLFGVGIFATRPYVLSASVWVALYYWAAGLALLWVPAASTRCRRGASAARSAIGQLFAAAVLYWNLERRQDE